MNPYFGGSSGNMIADRRYDFALQLAERGDHAAAADLYAQAAELAPLWPPLHFHLGEALRLSGKASAAIDAFNACLALDPADHMGATLKITLTGGTPAPASLPDAYIQSLFDQFAPRFDDTLVNALDYKTPSFLARAVRDVRPGPYPRILDLGCGTGLAAAELMADATYICGVDLSPAMVDIARAKDLYNDLHVGTIESFLENDVPAPYDLVLCADVFVYIGDLESIFARTAAQMKNGALFAFSVQTPQTGHKDWLLGPDHRYAHAPQYIDCIAHAAGLKPLHRDPVTLRMDGGKPVHGMVFVCEKPI